MTRRTLLVTALGSLGYVLSPALARARMADSTLLARGMLLNREHPLAEGLQYWLLTLPGMHSNTTVWDVTRRLPSTLAGMASPASATSGMERVTLRSGGFGEGRYDGTNDQIVVADAPVLRPTPPLTVCCFLRPTLFDLERGVFTKRGATGNWQSYGLNMAGAGFLKASVQNSVHGGWPVWSGTTVLTGNVWFHAAFVLRPVTGVGGDGDIYLNGIRDTNTGAFAANGYNSSFTIGYSTDPLRVGVISTDTPSAYFSGMIDDLRIYRRALSAPTIAALYVNALQGYPGLLNRWPSDGYVASVAAGVPVRKRGQVF